MDKTILLIIICVLVLLSIALTVTIILFVKSRKKWMLNSQENYLKGKEEGKNEAVSVINATINTIENDRNKLNQMSEKELMVSTMMALASYGRRLDETNERLNTITDYKIYISEMNKQMKTLSDSYDNLQNTIKTAENSLNDSIVSSQSKLKETVDSSKQSIESFDRTANRVSENVNVLNYRLSNVEDIRQRIDDINSDLDQSLDLLKSLQVQASSIMSEMDGMLKSYGQSPAAKLDAINHNVGEIFDWVEELHDKFDDIDMSDFEKIEDIYDKTKELYEKLEYVSESDFRDLDKLEDIHDKIKDLYDKFACVSTSDLMDLDKLGSIESALSDISSKLD